MNIANQLNDYRPPTGLLQDRVILVTGAGQGLGQAVSLAAAALGAKIILHGRTTAKLEKTYDAIVSAGGAMPAIAPLDFAGAGDDDFQQLAQMIRQEFGRLDGVVHCAARLKQLQPLANEKLDEWLALLRVNLAAPFALTRACMPLLALSEDASVIFVSESHGVNPAAYWGGFAVSKFALIGLLKVWNDELASDGKLRMNILVPGPMQTPQRALTHPGEDKSQLRSTSDVAPAFLYLLGEHGRGITGEIIDLEKRS
jgi:NAD(P)-dependent dehydrogenase (short-subunit alcohol dehydrogenase family)